MRHELPEDGSRCDSRQRNWCIIRNVWMSSCKRLHEWSVAGTSSINTTEVFHGDRAILPRHLSRRNSTTQTLVMAECHNDDRTLSLLVKPQLTKKSTFKYKYTLNVYPSKTIERALEPVLWQQSNKLAKGDTWRLFLQVLPDPMRRSTTAKNTQEEWYSRMVQYLRHDYSGKLSLNTVFTSHLHWDEKRWGCSSSSRFNNPCWFGYLSRREPCVKEVDAMDKINSDRQMEILLCCSPMTSHIKMCHDVRFV